MKRILHFFLNPSLSTEGDQPNGKLSILLDCIVFLIAVRFLFATIVYLEKIFSIDGIRTILRTHVSLNNGANEYMLIFLIALFLPLIEELSFRGPLTKNNTIAIISCSVLITYLINYLYQFDWGIVRISPQYRLLIGMGVIGIFVFALKTLRVEISQFIQSHMRLVTYTSITLFAVLHISNYNINALSTFQLLLMPVLLIPSISLAISFNYLRVYGGLFWAIGFHCAYNLLAILPTILSMRAESL